METLQLESMLSMLLLVGLRVSSVIVFAPFLSSQAIPPQGKAALTVLVTALLYPVCPQPAVAGGAFGWLEVVGGEIGIGLLLGLVVQLVVEGAQVAGQLLGMQAGYSLVTLLDPQSQADLPVLATFNQILALVIFLQLNVHHWLLRGLAASFAYAPPGSLVASARTGAALLHAAGGMWLAGVQMAGPVVVATFLVDVTLGFVSRAAPQLPVLFVGVSFKTSISLAVLAGSLVWWPARFEREFAAAISLGERLLHLAH